MDAEGILLKTDGGGRIGVCFAGVGAGVEVGWSGGVSTSSYHLELVEVSRKIRLLLLESLLLRSLEVLKDQQQQSPLFLFPE